MEEAPREALPKGVSGGKGGRKIAFVDLKGTSPAPPRRSTGIGELDRVCGGGLVAGSAILVGGDPGIGKSTLLLQAVGALAARGTSCVYVTGEEAVDQVRLRAARLGIDRCQRAARAAATSVRDIVASLDAAPTPDVVVIDSIQTMYTDAVDSAPGTVTQVRSAAQELIRIAKRRGFVLFLVGHVTKEGTLAGPRVLEHMVDTVLYFEGDRGHQFRILRAVKNRFGATDEIGVFAMTDAGLTEVANPSALFLAERRGNVSGSCVFAGIEGSRPVLVEIQALVAPSVLGTPRRATVGWDSGRLNMIIAVLETRCGLALGGNDIYLNVAGGLRIAEPAADLAVATALVSSLSGESVPADAVVFGEIGLSGEVRAVAQRDLRLKEAAKLGFQQAWVPRQSPKAQDIKAQDIKSGDTETAAKKDGLVIKSIGHVQDVVAKFTEAASKPGRGPRTGRKVPGGTRRGGNQRAAKAHGLLMPALPINGLDLTVGFILLISALLAFLRGFVQETLSIGAWIGATFGALYGVRYAHPYARKIIPLDWAADAAATVVLFLAILFVLSIATNLLARTVKRSALNPLDRSLGFLFGLLRGAVILSVAVIISNWLMKTEDRPVWMRTAKTLPLLEGGADILKSLIPQSFQRAEDAAKDAAAKVDQAAEMKRTLDRLTAPVPVAPGDKGEKSDRAAPANSGAAAPAGSVEDLIGQKVQEIDDKKTDKTPPTDGAK